MIHRRLVAVVVAAALAFAACSSGGGGSSAGTTSCIPPAGTTGGVAVSIKDFAFEPSAIVAKVGQAVTFTNTGFESHNATLDAGGCGTPTLETGQVGQLVFAAAGVYPFHCTVHAQMTGSITVGS